MKPTPLPARTVQTPGVLTYHLQGPSEDPTQQVGVDKCAVVIRQLYKVDQRVVLKHEGEFISRRAPVCHAGGDS